MKEYPENKKDATDEQKNNYYKNVYGAFNKRFKTLQQTKEKPT